MKNTHNAATFNPYDPSEILGNLGPAPKAVKNNKCGAFGAIIVSVVSIAVAAALPMVSGFFAAGVGKIAAAVIGSTVAQGFGVATGIQDKFSWKSVAMAGLSAGATLGVGELAGKIGGVAASGSKLAGAARAMIADAATQGVATLTGLQNKFDWAGVAAAGLGSFAASAALGASGKFLGGLKSQVARDFASAGIAATADGISSAAALSLIKGTSFGDNLIAVLPSVIGRTIGSVIAGEVQRADARAQAKRQAANLAAGAIEAGISAAGKALASSAPPVENLGNIITAPIELLDGFGYVDFFPERTAMQAAEFAADVQIGGVAYASARHRTKVIQELAAAANAESWADYAADDALDGRIDGVPFRVGGWKLSGTEVEQVRNMATAAYAAGEIDVNVRNAIFASADHNDALLAQWNAAADAEINKLLFLGIGAPVAIAGGLAAAPALLGGYGISSAFGAGIAVDFTQASVRGLLNGSLETQSTLGGTLIGDDNYALLSLGVGGTGLVRGMFRGGPRIGAAGSGAAHPLVVFDGEFATQQLLGTTTTPGGRQIMFHAADRMVNPPRGRVPMSASEIDDVLNGATRVVKRDYHPQGNTLTIENANLPGSPRVVVDEATGQRVITVINPRRR